MFFVIFSMTNRDFEWFGWGHAGIIWPSLSEVPPASVWLPLPSTSATSVGGTPRALAPAAAPGGKSQPWTSAGQGGEVGGSGVHLPGTM